MLLFPSLTAQCLFCLVCSGVPGPQGKTPLKYVLGGKYDAAIHPLPDEMQTLTDTRIQFIDGQTLMRFTKIMNEPGEIEIVAGKNIFLWAHGIDAITSYHHTNRSPFELNLLNGSSSVRVRH